jgi:hypothetical protein
MFNCFQVNTFEYRVMSEILFENWAHVLLITLRKV